MSDERDKIFTAIREALAPLPERTAYPEWERELPISHAHPDFPNLKELFAHKLQAANGRFYDSVPELVKYLVGEGSTFGYCDPALADRFKEAGDLTLETEFNLEKVNDYTFGITKASHAVAESGTIMLKDAVTSSRLGALAPWIHIAVIEESDLLADLPSAIDKFGDDPAIVWCTGPSKTADVEGILIEGVHGPGIQIALVLS